MSQKHGGHGRGTRDNGTLSFYIPDKLHEMVESFAKSSGVDAEEAYRKLLSKGLVAQSARDYFDLLLMRNSLARSELYSTYSKDLSILRRLVDQVRGDNEAVRELLLKRGLLKHVPEKPRS